MQLLDRTLLKETKRIRRSKILGTSLKDMFSIEFVASALFVYWANVQLFYSRPDYFNYGVYLLTPVVLVIRANMISKSHIYIILSTVFISSVSLLLPSGEFYSPYLFVFLFSGSLGVLFSSIIKKPQFIIFWQLAISTPIAIKSFLDYQQMIGAGSSYMPAAYHLFYVFCCLLLIYIFKKGTFLLLIPIILIASLIMFTGTRGAIIAVLLSVISSYLIKKHNESLIKNFILPAIAVIILLVLFGEKILLFMEYLKDLFGFHSRFFYLVNSGTIFSSSARVRIYTIVIDSFLNGNILGLGLGAVPYLTNGEFYAHNFVIELLADFGILSIIIIYGFYRLLKLSVWKTVNNDFLIAGLLCVFLVIFPLLFSGTILDSYTLPMLGILFQIKRLNKGLISGRNKKY